MSRKTICVDLDGVIAEYTGWKGSEVIGDPLPGAREALHKLRVEGWQIIIFTTRGNKDAVHVYLHRHDIPYDEINKSIKALPGANPGKPYADVYLDDRAVRFNGDWSLAFKDIINADPWWKTK